MRERWQFTSLRSAHSRCAETLVLCAQPWWDVDPSTVEAGSETSFLRGDVEKYRGPHGARKVDVQLDHGRRCRFSTFTRGANRSILAR